MQKIKINMPKKYDRWIHASVIVLIILGSLMIVSTSVGETSNNNAVVIKTLIKQSAFVLVAYAAMVLFANSFSFEKAMKKIRLVGAGIVILLIACFFFDPVGGARSWIRFSLPGIGQFTIQPSEFMKVFMIVLMAVFVEKVKKSHLDWWSIVKIPFSFYMIGAFLILLQNDTGSFIVLSLICVICLLIPTHPSLAKLQKVMGILLVCGSCFMVFIASDLGLHLLEKMDFIDNYIIKRFTMASNPWLDETDKGYQLINSLYAFASGGWTGVGFGQSIQKMGYLPEASTDYILATTVEELGISGFLVILGGYGIIIFRLFQYAFLTRKEGYKILYIGTAMFLFIHFVFNVGGVTGLIPLTGVPLLFISSGASSLVSVCSAIGICQAVLAKENRERAS